MYSRAGAAALVLFVLVALGAVALASPAKDVTPTLLARGTYASFKVKSAPAGPIEFEAEAKPAVDVVVRRHDYLAGAHTGWHSHPGPVFITVKEGTLTYYEYDDPNCTPHVVSAGQGFVDDGRGHIVRNENDQPAVDVSVIIAPVGGAFRSELTAPGPFCEF
jgi:quercetin dioxygenase-like cupin family protein